MKKRILDEGVPGSSQPNPKDHVEVYYTVKFSLDNEEKHIFSSSLVHDLPLRFTVGSGVVLGPLEEAVRTMAIGEKAVFEFLAPSAEFFEFVSGFGLSSDLNLSSRGACSLELVLVKHLPKSSSADSLLSLSPWEIPQSQRVSAATQLKDLGNKSLVAKEFETAIEFYEKGYSLVSGMLSNQAREIGLILLLNKAQALLSFKKPAEAIKICDLVINKSYFTPKAWYRKACGLIETENMQAAKELLEEALEMFGGKEFKDKLDEAIVIEKRLENKEKKFYANMLK